MYGMMLRTTWDRDRIWVWDSAFYTKKNLQALPPDMVWITRVPETLTLAQKLLQNAENMTATSMKGYSIQSTTVTYAGVQQRWIVVLSEQAYNREKKTLKKKTQQEKEMVKTALWHLSHQEFRCREDGRSALQELAKKWKYHCTQKIDLVKKQRKKNGGKGRPKTGDPKTTVYLVTATAQENDVEIHRCLQSLGRFIVATKELNAEKLSDEDTVKAYKDQQQVERGFRFLKDPLFFAHAIFLKTERRIQAMVMIMGLALLIYAIAEKKLRDALKTMDETLPDQRGKPTKTPTMRRMFQTFEGVSVLYNEQGELLEIMNLSETSRKVLLLFGEEYMEAYGLK
jgi:transposase